MSLGGVTCGGYCMRGGGGAGGKQHMVVAVLMLQIHWQ
jgi:hypothetical protein